MTVSITLPRGDGAVSFDAIVASSLRERTRGLLGRPPLRDGQALILPRTHQIHTVGMRYAIGVVFCDERWVVVRVCRSMAPMRVTRWVVRARWAIEFPAGTVGSLQVGDRLVVSGL
ncbi:MAG: uncharacterized protein QOF16_139 [Actinomycetota bacterium]|nr:uncharacterized protein [Actinomycetota bacterium]